MELKEKITLWIKKYRYVALVLLVGIALMLIPQRKQTQQQPVQETATTAKQDLAQELEEILSHVQGAGRVQVMLTMRAGASTVYKADGDEDPVIITDADRTQQGLVERVDPPQYQGAIILCGGADDPSVRLSIIEAVSRVTGLGTDKICVLKIK